MPLSSNGRISTVMSARVKNQRSLYFGKMQPVEEEQEDGTKSTKQIPLLRYYSVKVCVINSDRRKLLP